MVLAVVAGTQVSSSSALAFEQDPLPQLSDALTVQGTIRDIAGLPVAVATVFLEEKGSSTRVETKTNAAGAFMLSAIHPGTYILRARKSGWRDAVMDPLVLSTWRQKARGFGAPDAAVDKSRFSRVDAIR